MARSADIEATGTPRMAARPVHTEIMSTVRPVLAGVVVFAAAFVAGRNVPDLPPDSPLLRYALQGVALFAVLIGALVTWAARRRGASWDADIWPALLGGAAVFSLSAVLHGTPFAPNGIQSDQAFRTESITRFADTWALVDFTQKDLPAFYAPAYFWVLGRIADVTDVAPWLFVQWGMLVVAMIVPILAFVLWRRHVSSTLAAVIAAVPLIVQNWYEPYAWVVITAIVPWWLEVVHGHIRPGVRPWHPILLGAIGAVLFLTYYYFFFIAAIALIIHVAVELVAGRLDRQQLPRSVVAFATMVALAAVFWVPLLGSMLAADNPETIANRWFSDSHGIPRLPFLDASVAGVASLIGLLFLAVTAGREPLSRALLVFLGAAYGWYLIGLVAALLDVPLLSFRGSPLVNVLLLTAGVVGFGRIVTLAQEHPAATRRSHVVVAATAVAIGIFLVFAMSSFAIGVFTSTHMQRAYNERLPNGDVLPHGLPDPTAPYASADEIAAVIDGRYRGTDHPVLLSTRSDVLAFNPYYGFVQWQAYYAHPAAEFSERIAFLGSLASLTDPSQFAQQSANNQFDRIDAFVLRATDTALVLEYRDDAFPDRGTLGRVAFPPELFDVTHFDVVEIDGYVVAVRKGTAP